MSLELRCTETVGLLPQSTHLTLSAIPLLAIALLALSSTARAEDLSDVSAPSPWTVHETNDDAENGYVVYTRKPAGSKFSEYRIEAVVNYPTAVVAAVAVKNLADPEFRPKGTIKTIIQNDEEALLVHSHIAINAPFVSDRDVVTRVEQTFDSLTATHSIVWRATNEGPPPRDGVVRLDRSDGYWSFTPEDENRTKAVYVSHTEIAGSIPAWVINSVMSTTMTEGIEGLRASLVRETEHP